VDSDTDERLLGTGRFDGCGLGRRYRYLTSISASRYTTLTSIHHPVASSGTWWKPFYAPESGSSNFEFGWEQFTWRSTRRCKWARCFTPWSRARYSHVSRLLEPRRFLTRGNYLAKPPKGVRFFLGGSSASGAGYDATIASERSRSSDWRVLSWTRSAGFCARAGLEGNHRERGCDRRGYGSRRASGIGLQVRYRVNGWGGISSHRAHEARVIAPLQESPKSTWMRYQFRP
jgi:hypothetical protein